MALLHDGGLIHGDLTTSNMLLRSPDNKLVITPAFDTGLFNAVLGLLFLWYACCWLDSIAREG